MKPLSPKDASLLALIAGNPGMSLERMMTLLEIADDVEEVKAVARLLLNGTTPNGVAPTQQAQASATALKDWALENRTLILR